MKKIIKLTESDIQNIVKKVIKEELPKKEQDRKDTQYRRDMFNPYKREEGIMDIFGPYKNDVPPNVIQYMRKNPSLVIKRLTSVYGLSNMLKYMDIPNNQFDITESEIEKLVGDVLKEEDYNFTTVNRSELIDNGSSWSAESNVQHSKGKRPYILDNKTKQFEIIPKGKSHPVKTYYLYPDQARELNRLGEQYIECLSTYNTNYNRIMSQNNK